MRRRVGRMVGAAALAGLLVGGCSATDDGDSASTEAGGASGDDAVTVGGEAGDAPALQVDVPEAPERIVRTATLRVRVDAPADAAQEAQDLVEAAGGSVSSQVEEDGSDEVDVVLRVPAERFQEVVDDLRALGEVLDQRVSAEEVTDQVVDLEGRLATAEASRDRLRELFAEARDVNHVVALEQALTEREAEVEALQGQLQVLEDRADRSTIDVTFTREVQVEVDDDIPGFTEGLRNGWVAFRNVVAVGVTVLGFVLPFLVPLVVAGFAARAVIRRRARRRPPRPTVTAPGPWPHAPAGGHPHAPAATTSPPPAATTPQPPAAEPDPPEPDPPEDG